MNVSDQTLAEMLAARLRAARVYRLFALEIGPEDVVYVSALALKDDGSVVEVRASAEEFEDAFVQLFQNVDTATAPEEP